MADNKSHIRLASEIPQQPFSSAWRPGPAKGNDPASKDFVEVGDRFLVLVHCVDDRNDCNDFWDAHVIVATEAGFDDADGDTWLAWHWSDVSWYLPLNKEILPPLV